MRRSRDKTLVNRRRRDEPVAIRYDGGWVAFNNERGDWGMKSFVHSQPPRPVSSTVSLSRTAAHERPANEPDREPGRRRARRVRGGNSGESGAPPVVREVLASPGQPLDAGARGFFESRFGHDFSRVRVHADTMAAASASALAASAYAVGGHLAFGAGQYQPTTVVGRQLIAHELMHVLQDGARPMPSDLAVASADSPRERQADTASRELLVSGGAAGGPSLVPVASGTDDRCIQRRRVPAAAGLGSALPAAGPTLGAAKTGLARALGRAWAGLTGAQQTAVRQRRPLASPGQRKQTSSRRSTQRAARSSSASSRRFVPRRLPRNSEIRR